MGEQLSVVSLHLIMEVALHQETEIFCIGENCFCLSQLTPGTNCINQPTPLAATGLHTQPTLWHLSNTESHEYRHRIWAAALPYR